MLAIVTGTADGEHVTGEQRTPEDHARFINELVDNHTELDIKVHLLREDRAESEYKITKGVKPNA